MWAVNRTLVLGNGSLFNGNVASVSELGPTGLTVIPGTPEIVGVATTSQTIFRFNTSSRLIGEVATGGTDPGSVLYVPSENAFYTTNVNDQNLTEFNATSLVEVANFPVGNDPLGLTYDPLTHSVIVTDDQAAEASAVAPNGTVTTLPAGQGPDGIAYDPVDGDLWIADRLANYVTVLNATNYSTQAFVTVGQCPDDVAVDPANGTVLVANSCTSNVSEVSPTTLKVTGSVSVGPGPGSLTVAPSHDWLYVADANSNNVTIVNLSSATSHHSVPISAGGPHTLVLVPSTDSVYVSDPASDGLTVINASSGQFETEVQVGTQPGTPAVDPQTGGTFLPLSDTGHVAAVDGVGAEITRSYSVGGDLQGAAYDPLDQDLYVVNASAGQLAVVDTQTGRVIATPPAGVGAEEDVFAPDANEVVISNPAAATLTIVNTTTNQFVESVHASFPYPGTVAYNPHNGWVYVGSLQYTFLFNGTIVAYSKVGVFNPHTNTFSGVTNAGAIVEGLAADPATGDVYAVNAETTNVSVIAPGSTPVVLGTYGLTSYSFPIGGAFDAFDQVLAIPEYYLNQVVLLNPTNGATVATIPVGNGPTAVVVDPAGSDLIVVNQLAGSLSLIPDGSPPTYRVTVNESGLPSGTPWGVQVNGTLYSSSGGPIDFREPSGNYPIVGETVANYSLNSSNPSGFVVFGGGVSLLFIYDRIPPRYLVSFVETGLPTETTWTVTIGNRTNTSAGTTADFELPNATYTYSLGLVAGYETVNHSGRFSVAGGPVQFRLPWVISLFEVTFVESGLPTGASWTVTLGGRSMSSSTDTIAFPEPNGTYSYNVTPVVGYVAGLPQGSTPVDGQGNTIDVGFTAAPSSGPGSTLTVGGLSVIDLAGIAAIVAVVAVVAVLLSRRGRSRPPPKDEEAVEEPPAVQPPAEMAPEPAEPIVEPSEPQDDEIYGADRQLPPRLTRPP